MQKILPKDPKKVYIDVKHLKVFVVLMIIITVLGFQTAPRIKAEREARTCKELFKTQPEAQDAFNANSIKYKKLDRDHDGLACEDLPLTVHVK